MVRETSPYGESRPTHSKNPNNPKKSHLPDRESNELVIESKVQS